MLQNSVFYAQPTYQNEPLFLVKVSNPIIKAYEKHLKLQKIKLVPAPSFEFYEPSELGKFTIESKNDF